MNINNYREIVDRLHLLESINDWVIEFVESKDVSIINLYKHKFPTLFFRIKPTGTYFTVTDNDLFEKMGTAHNYNNVIETILISIKEIERFYFNKPRF